MKLNIYKNQKEIAKTFEVDNYDLMYGTVQDILTIMDDLDDFNDNTKLIELIQKNRTKLDDLLIDIFSPVGMKPEDLRMIKIKELIPVFVDLFNYVKESFTSKN